MELWIRSQSRHNLMKANDIVAKDNQIEVYKESEISTVVGKYKSKERALEVLDHIQFLIEQTGELTEKIVEDIRKLLKDEMWSINSTSNTATYEMPKE